MPVRAASPQPNPVTLFDAIEAMARRKPGAVAFTFLSTRAAPLEVSYAELERRLGTDWGALIEALHFIPLAREGKHHAELRRDFA